MAQYWALSAASMNLSMSVISWGMVSSASLLDNVVGNDVLSVLVQAVA